MAVFLLTKIKPRIKILWPRGSLLRKRKIVITQWLYRNVNCHPRNETRIDREFIYGLTVHYTFIKNLYTYDITWWGSVISTNLNLKQIQYVITTTNDLINKFSRQRCYRTFLVYTVGAWFILLVCTYKHMVQEIYLFANHHLHIKRGTFKTDDQVKTAD